MLLSVVFKAFDLVGLVLHLPDEIIDHIGQLFDLDILCINAAVQLVNNLLYTISRLSHEVNTFVKTINGVILMLV